MIDIEFYEGPTGSADGWKEPESIGEECKTDALSVFNAIIKSEVLSNDELFELSCYLKTYSELHHVV